MVLDESSEVFANGMHVQTLIQVI